MANRVLLTGAGFTYNFGAPLAHEMATHIFNSLKCPEGKKLKETLRNHAYNYEDVYLDIITGDYTTDEKKRMYNALSEAYKYLDNIINKINNEQSHIIHLIEDELIRNLQINRYGSGFIFTLNQDLFIERRCRHKVDIVYRLPAANTKFLMPDNIDQNFDLNLCSYNNDSSQIEEEKNKFLAELGKIRERRNSTPLIAYVKLHGSMDWFINEVNQLMIVGGNKIDYINKLPLLKWYYELFKNELSKEEVKLLIIGYGFMDDHINLAIKEAIEIYGLQLYIINPTKQVEFEKELFNKKYGDEILNAICGYYPYSLKDLFTKESITTQWSAIKDQFFLN